MAASVAEGPQEGPEGAVERRTGRKGPKARKTKIKTPQSVSKGQKRIEAQQKARLALEGRKAGLSYEAIAERVGYADASGARKAVVRAFGQVIQEPASDLKALQIERINHMLVALWPKAQAGDERAIGTALALMDKLDRYEGTEAASKSEIKHTGSVLIVEGDKDEYLAAMKQMAGVAENGTNLTAVQVGELPQGNTTTSSEGVTVTYPAGMAPSSYSQAGDDPVEDVVDAELVEETPEERDDSSTANVGKGKTYNFGVDPITHKKETKDD